MEPSYKFSRIKAWSTVDAIFFSAMIGLGETFFVPYALERGLSAENSGLLGTWPMCLGAALQFFVSKKLPDQTSPKKILAIIISLQIICLLTLAVFGSHFSGKPLFYFVMLVSTCYWFCTFTAGPIWNLWITRFFDRDQLVEFFSNRLKYSQLSVCLTFLGAGVLLHSRLLSVDLAFATIFGIAGFSRMISGLSLAQLPDREVDLDNLSGKLHTPRGGNIKSMRSFILFVCSLYGSVYLAAPFFTAYMLQRQGFSYAEFSLITASLVLARFIFAPYIQKLQLRIGITKLMALGTFIVIWLPVLWLVSDSIAYLCILQVAAGFGWGSLELGLNVYMVENWHSRDRSQVLSWFNLTMASSMAVGSYLGAQILYASGSYDYIVAFSVSTIARFIPLVLIAQVEGPQVSVRPMLFRLISIRPGSGPLSKPVLVKKDDRL